MIRGRALDVIRLSPILKQQGDIFQKTTLISFDGKMVMGLTLDNQILGDRTLGQERIRRHILAFQIDRIQQGNGYSDLIGAFDAFAGGGYGSDFF